MQLTVASSLEDKAIPSFELGYLKAAAMDEAYNVVFNLFRKESGESSQINRAFVGRRVGKSPAQITRYLSSPGNLTLETYAVLCAAFGHKATFGSEKISDMRQGNYHHELSEGSADYLSLANKNSARLRDNNLQPSYIDRLQSAAPVPLANNSSVDQANSFASQPLAPTGNNLGPEPGIAFGCFSQRANR